jgi:hypothetical protein
MGMIGELRAAFAYLPIYEKTNFFRLATRAPRLDRWSKCQRRRRKGDDRAWFVNKGLDPYWRGSKISSWALSAPCLCHPCTWAKTIVLVKILTSTMLVNILTSSMLVNILTQHSDFLGRTNPPHYTVSCSRSTFWLPRQIESSALHCLMLPLDVYSGNEPPIYIFSLCRYARMRVSAPGGTPTSEALSWAILLSCSIFLDKEFNRALSRASFVILLNSNFYVNNLYFYWCRYDLSHIISFPFVWTLLPSNYHRLKTRSTPHQLVFEQNTCIIILHIPLDV